MKAFKQITSLNLLALFALGYSELAIDELQSPTPSIALHTEQKEQIKELLGKERFALVVSETYSFSVLEQMIHQRLPEKFKHQSKMISEILLLEAQKNNLDPFFLFAVIMTESSFNPEAKGRHGEIGLMQILPDTGAWMAKRLNFKETLDLKNPKHNILLGAAYLSKLRNKFDRVGNRYIAAYNMGPKNVSRLLASNKEPRIYSDKVLNHYNRIHQQAQKNASVKTQVAAL